MEGHIERLSDEPDQMQERSAAEIDADFVEVGGGKQYLDRDATRARCLLETVLDTRDHTARAADALERIATALEAK